MSKACERLLCTSEERIPDIKLSVYFKIHVVVKGEAYSHLEITTVTVIFQYRHTGRVMKAAEQIRGKDTDHDQIKGRYRLFNDRGYLAIQVL